MIKVKAIENTDANSNDYLIIAFADTKAEVVPGATYIGLPDGAGIEMGSRLMTADGELAYMKSNGQWNWV